jgi:hypothetical protein
VRAIILKNKFQLIVSKMSENEKAKNPLLKSSEDISTISKRSITYFEKIGLVSVLILTLAIFILAVISLIVDTIIKFSFLFLLDIIFIILSAVAVQFLINIIRTKMVTELLIDTAFQKGVYTRLQPVIDNIATSSTGTDVVLDKISKLDTKVENILKEKTTVQIPEEGKLLEEYISLGTTVKFVIKSIFMIVVTMAIFMFLVNFNLGGITPYLTLTIFILWWVFITNEYGLWKDSSAWTMVFFPILIIPATFVILSNILNYNVLMALLYVMLGAYIVLYYVWAVYVSTGSIPFLAPSDKKKELVKESNKTEHIPEEEHFFEVRQPSLLNTILKKMKR